MSSTIYALSSGALPAGVAVIRVSGPHTRAVIAALTRQPLPTPRHAVLRKIVRPPDGTSKDHALIDEGLLLFFAAPQSFTGEDVAEFHVHGGRAVVAALLEVLSRLPHMRGAEPGEFTRRAFENGRIDLTAAEALADLIQAETQAQHFQAIAQAGGALARLYDGWREELIAAMALVEADIDFADEGLPGDIVAQAKQKLLVLQDEIAAHLDDNHRGERLRDGIRIAVLGLPNSGKSSIMNRLAKREAAIVSDIAGTTRDVIEVHLDLGGYPVILADTAGLREVHDVVEAEGVRRAQAQAEAADIRLLVYDASAGGLPETLQAMADERAMILANKLDVVGNIELPTTYWGLSAKTGEGFGPWLEALEARIRAEFTPARESAPITRARHREALQAARAALERGIALLGRDEVMAAEDLRVAAHALGRITGRVDVEDVLDSIFSEFCIGK